MRRYRLALRARPQRSRRRAGGVASVLVSIAVLPGACAQEDEPPAAGVEPDAGLDGAEVVLRFDEVSVPGDAVPTAVNDGPAAVDVSVSTAGGGRLTWTDGHEGGAVRTPEFGAAADTPTAALVVRPRRAGDLDPRNRDFTIGVDFVVDPPDRGRAGDDGANLVQVGRFDDASQAKIQLDHGVPSCRLGGTGGSVVVTAPEPVVAGRWYRLTCRRTAGRVVLELDDLRGGHSPSTWARRADPGDVRFGAAPLSVGAKVAVDGGIDIRSSDQFHGVIDRVVVDVS